MAKIVYVKDEYVIRETNDGYILINTRGEYENHGHIKKLNTAKSIIWLMKKKTVPRSDYLRGTVLRVSLDRDYKQKVLNKIQKDKEKGFYININKGIKRK